MTCTCRTSGPPPYRVAVLHGGPGAPGSAAALARELGRRRGVLEPMQSARSVDGQVQELQAILTQRAELPVAVVGWSWGSVLGFLLAARHPGTVRRLVLVSSAVFDPQAARSVEPARLNRLDGRERARVLALRAALAGSSRGDDGALLAELGRLLGRADAYDPLPAARGEALPVQPDVYREVWAEAEQLRTSGELVEAGRAIRCPVLAIHGADDPHPAEGVREPLARVLADFRFVLLPRCGHVPWAERHARARFLRLLDAELDR